MPVQEAILMHTGLLDSSSEKKVLAVLKVPSLGTSKPCNEPSLGTTKSCNEEVRAAGGTNSHRLYSSLKGFTALQGRMRDVRL